MAKWRVTVAHPERGVLFTMLVNCEPAEEPKPTPVSATRPLAPRPVTANGPTASDGDPRMTDPQKRYLFRLLAEQGVEGKQAEEHLKQYFKVKALRDVTKASASQLIEQMVADRKEAAGGAA